MALTQLPTPDVLMASVLETQLTSLELKVKAGLTYDCGIIRVEGIPFVWALNWKPKEEDESTDFTLEISHVRINVGHGAKDLKLVVTRDFNLKKDELCS